MQRPIIVPKPGPTTPQMQKVADQSWQGIKGVSPTGCGCPKDALAKDPRKKGQ